MGSTRIRVGENSFRIATGGHDIGLTTEKKRTTENTENTEKDFLIRVVASTMPGGHATGGGRMLSMDPPVAVLQDE
jgi:hypothetical protein